MLPKENRLPVGGFSLIKENGKLIKTPFFLMISRFRQDLNPTRFGFIVSTKVSKKAVERNRIKRALRDAVRILKPQIKNGYDILFIAYQKSLFLEKESLLIK